MSLGLQRIPHSMARWSRRKNTIKIRARQMENDKTVRREMLLTDKLMSFGISNKKRREVVFSPFTCREGRMPHNYGRQQLTSDQNDFQCMTPVLLLPASVTGQMKY